MERVIADVGLVLACGGSGQRFGADRNKLLENWQGLPLFCHSLRAFLPLLNPDHVVVVCPAALVATFRTILGESGFPAGVRIVPGGAQRQDSVEAGLLALPPAVAIVAVQDGARPLSSAELLLRCVASARDHGSGVAARRVTDTIKIADARGRVSATPDRTTLWAAETPQVFRRETLTAALRQARESGRKVTDDAQAVELLGKPVFLVEHARMNPKITFPDDVARLTSCSGQLPG